MHTDTDTNLRTLIKVYEFAPLTSLETIGNAVAVVELPAVLI
jgi:hypothetical protein